MSKAKEAAPPEGTQYEIWVHLFETGSANEIGKDAVVISATAHVAALREAIIHKFKSEVAAYQLVVKPTHDGAPLAAEMRLWKVMFELDADQERHAYVEVPKRKAPKKNTGALSAQEAISHSFCAGYGECKSFLEDLARRWADEPEPNVTQALKSLRDDCDSYLPVFVRKNPEYTWLQEHQLSAAFPRIWQRLCSEFTRDGMPSGSDRIIIPDTLRNLGDDDMRALKCLISTKKLRWVLMDHFGTVLEESSDDEMEKSSQEGKKSDKKSDAHPPTNKNQKTLEKQEIPLLFKRKKLKQLRENVSAQALQDEPSKKKTKDS